MNNYIRFVKITNYANLTDRFLTAAVKMPQHFQQNSKGDVFSILEITKPWSTVSAIGSRIINSFIHTYYTVQDRNDSDSFEQGIKEINEHLGHIIRSGQTSWIGNLNSVFCIINNSKIFLTQSGKAQAYLFRDNHLSQITDEAPKNDPHPLKTFSNIISGDLKNGDKLLLASPALFDFISLDRIKQITCQNDLYSSAQQIADILRNEKTRLVNLIIIQVNSKEEFGSQILENNTDTIYLDQKSAFLAVQNIKSYMAVLSPLIAKFKKYSKNAFRKISDFIGKKAVPLTKANFHKVHSYFQTKIDENKKKKEQSSKKVIIAPAKVQTPLEIKKEKLYKINHYYEKTKPAAKLWLNSIKQIWQNLYEIIKKIIQFIFNKKNQSLFYIILIILLIGILIISIGKLRQNKENRQNLQTQQTQLKDAQSKLNNDVKLAILYNEKTKAIALINEIIVISLQIKNNPDLAQEAQKLSNDAQAQMDQLTQTTRLFDSREVASFNDSFAFAATKNLVFSITDPPSPIIGSKLLSSGQNKEINIPAIGGNAKLIANLGDDNSILTYTSKGEVYKTASVEGDIERVYPIKGVWTNIDLMTTFAGSIYALNKNADQIIKYEKNNNGYQEGVDYLKEEVDLANTISFSIDGKIYLLNLDGSIKQLNRGRSADFDLKGIPEPNTAITNPKKIYTSADADSIFVLDANRIVKFSKNGNFTSQYVFDGKNNVADFTIDLSNKKVYILDSNIICEYNL